MQPLPRQLAGVALIASVALAAACGKKAPGVTPSHDAGSTRAAVAPLAMPVLGVDRVGRFDFLYGDGAAAYNKALAARRGKTPDWRAVSTACEAAIARDPDHLDAQWLLGVALAQTDDPAAAVDHLVAALAADEPTYAPRLADDADLAAFRATPHGQAVIALAAQIHAEMLRRAAAGLWLLGRRSTFKWPSKDGVEFDSSRGELYAYDRASKRYLRLTHTDHQVTAALRAPGGAEVAIVGFDRVDHGKDDTTPPLFARAWVEELDPATWKQLGKRAVLPSAREVSIGFGAGDQLLIGTAPATGRWTVGDTTMWTIDRTNGKLARVGAPPPVPRIELSLEEGRVVRAPAGVEAAWAGDPPTAPALKTAAGATIQVPESGQAAEASVAASPDGAFVALATAVDPCAPDLAPSLYVADGKTGTLQHLYTAKSRFATRWLDATTLAYEDGDGGIRLWSTTTRRQLVRLSELGGLALDVLAISPAPLCKQAPAPVAAPAGSGDEPMPPEEASGSAD